MAAIQFTQFKRPSGRPVPVSINRPADISALAEKIESLGFRFECEHLSTNVVSLTISDDDGDHDIELVPNGERVPDAVDRLILRFAKHQEIAP